MKRVHCIAGLILLAALLVPAVAQDKEEAIIISAWDAYKDTDTNTPAGAFYLGFVLGVLQGANDNSQALAHVPDEISIRDMAETVGAYVDKHRAEASFQALRSSEIVIKAVLAKYPAPIPTDHKL